MNAEETSLNAQLSVQAQAERARKAALFLRSATSAMKDDALQRVASAILQNEGRIEAANRLDVADAKAKGKNAAFLDRLTLSGDRISKLAAGVLAVRSLADPIGMVLSHTTRDDGLDVSRVRAPLGVIAFIYEARPGVTIESAVLCLKAGSATILRAGSEAARTSSLLAEIMGSALFDAGLPADCVQTLQDLRHEAIVDLVRLEGFVDLVIPRGGEQLIRSVVENARVPVLKHYKGVCHIYVHGDADLEKAIEVILNSKCQRPGVCNALETLLVAREVADAFIPAICERLENAGVEIRGDERVRALYENAKAATDDDWHAEYLDLILAVRVVDDLESAIQHINTYSSKHTDVILSESEAAQTRFVQEVDSAAVFINASTRLCDGGELGLGSEIGISTDKLHARGPMGLVELTTYQWRVRGDGHLRNA